MKELRVNLAGRYVACNKACRARLPELFRFVLKSELLVRGVKSVRMFDDDVVQFCC
jgi:hypothetical protein